jgi:hypothetical protein
LFENWKNCRIDSNCFLPLCESCVILASMVASAEATRSLVRDAQRLADEIETLCGQFQKIDALPAIRRFMALHAEGNPDFDMLSAAKNLRCYAGVLSVITRTSPQPEIASPAKPQSRPKLPVATGT